LNISFFPPTTLWLVANIKQKWDINMRGKVIKRREVDICA
jgi:hypothetical protein